MELTVKRGANGYRIGDSHQRAELTDQEVERMRRLREQGVKVSDLQRMFEVTKGYVSKVCNFHLRRGR
jgi:hypothetical protein